MATQKDLERLDGQVMSGFAATGELSKVKEFLSKLWHGGSVVSTAKLTPEGVQDAANTGNLYVDDFNYGYAYLPDDK